MIQNISYSNQIDQNQIGAPADLRFCFKCNWEGHSAAGGCPQCGSVLYSQQNVRQRGVFMTFMGAFLCVFMFGIAAFVTKLLKDAAADPRNADRFENEGHLFVLTYLIFGGVIMIGVAAIAMGLWQYVYGKRNLLLLKVFFALISITISVGALFSVLAD